MSQNDLTIDNAVAATVRADLNSALAALSSLQSGATAPSPTVAGQFWYDTSSGGVRIRNEDNSDWSDVLISIPNGGDPALAPPLPRNHIDGFLLSNNVTDSDHDIDVAAGEAYATNDGSTISDGVGTTISIDNAGDRVDSSSLSADETYHVLVGTLTAGTFAAGFVKTAGLSLPSGWASFRRVGSVLTDGSSNIRQFDQVRGRFSLVSPGTAAFNLGSTSLVTITLSPFPTGVRMGFIGSVKNITGVTGSDRSGINVHPTTVTADPGTGTGFSQAPRTGSSDNQSNLIPAFGTGAWITNTSGQLKAISSDNNSGDDLQVVVYGWEDFRGQE